MIFGRKEYFEHIRGLDLTNIEKTTKDGSFVKHAS